MMFNKVIYRCVNIGIIRFSMLLIVFFSSCSEFLEVDVPANRLPSDDVFNNASTARGALANVYVRIRNTASSPVSGTTSVGYLNALYADELDLNSDEDAFFENALLVTDNTVDGFWRNTYELIFQANAVIEGLMESTIDEAIRNQLTGEALFLRAYLHSILVENFGAIPYIATADFEVNNSVARMNVSKVYEEIVSDLTTARGLLGDISTSSGKVRAYDTLVDALLARTYLFTEAWEAAENSASLVIDALAWETDVNDVFLVNSSGTIWQLQTGQSGQNAWEGIVYFVLAAPPPSGSTTMTNTLVTAFEPGDLRRTNWVREITDGSQVWFHPFKYKEFSITSGSGSREYSIPFRLAEQYLIRAEARARQGNIEGAQQDLNLVRTRAGLDNTTAANTADLLDAILQERRVELFTEYGHRFFDLKRTGRANAVLSAVKPGWNETDILFPIPQTELDANSNLLPQNPGYD